MLDIIYNNLVLMPAYNLMYAIDEIEASEIPTDKPSSDEVKNIY